METKSCCGSNGPMHKKDCPTKAVPPQATATDSAVPAETAAPGDVAAELAAADTGEEASESKAPAAPSKAKTLDLSQFEPEQVEALREFLETGVRRVKSQKEAPKSIIEVREYDGHLVTSFERGTRKLVRDDEQQKDVQKTFIRFKTENGEKNEISYNAFMNLPRVKCALMATEEKKDVAEFGEVKSAELSEAAGHAVMVPVCVTYVRRTFRLRKPDGKEFMLDSRFI